MSYSESCSTCNGALGICTMCQGCFRQHCRCEPCAHGKKQAEECIFCLRNLALGALPVEQMDSNLEGITASLPQKGDAIIE